MVHSAQLCPHSISPYLTGDFQPEANILTGPVIQALETSWS